MTKKEEFNQKKKTFFQQLRKSQKTDFTFRIDLLFSLIEEDTGVMKNVHFVEDASLYIRHLFIEFDSEHPEHARIHYRNRGSQVENFSDFLEDLRLHSDERLFLELKINGQSGAELYGDLMRDEDYSSDMLPEEDRRIPYSFTKIVPVYEGNREQEDTTMIQEGNIELIMLEIEKRSTLKLIDIALDKKDKHLFEFLTQRLAQIGLDIAEMSDSIVEIF